MFSEPEFHQLVLQGDQCLYREGAVRQEMSPLAAIFEQHL